MEVIHINSSVLNISHRPDNSTVGEMTVYERCKHMPSILIWYLGLQFINTFLGIPANLTVLWLIHKNKDSSSSDIFIFQLAILDMLFCLILPLELANKLFPDTSSSWFVLRFFYGLKDSSPLFLSCICLDRYLAVVHPIFFTELNGRHHRTVLAIVVWIIILAYTAAYCVGNIPNFNKVFPAMIPAAFAFMVFCNIAILWALRQSGPGRDEMHPMKKRAFKMVLIILAIIVFHYLPPVALFPFEEYFSPDVFLCYINFLAFGLMDLSSSVQPMLYLSKEKMPQSLNCCHSCTTHAQ
ncbi:proteinase-activated receptor 3-like [Solea solea]|uniref:proteinase-activated receptor 3-like n=1 Tax=Solea solea TaxID=90069 RepID=UPI00272CFF7C|nr:proteinase-activated receptor 3-like [Solea solea]